MRPYQKRLALAVAMVAGLSLGVALPGAAQTTWTVATTADDGGENTLRAALAFAQDGDTIDITATGTMYLEPIFGPLLVDKSVTINGPGQELLTIDGGYVEGMGMGIPVFWVGFYWGSQIPGVTASISGLSIANGAWEVGGGILNCGDLTLNDCTLSGNYAEYGGAVGNLATLALTDCVLSNNTAVSIGGAVFNGNMGMSPAGTSLTVTRCTLTGNQVTETGWGSGGGAIANFALANTSTLSIEDSTLSGNCAQLGGAIYNLSQGDYSTGAPGYAEANILRSTLSGNYAAASESIAMGGAIFQMAGSDPEAYATTTVDSSTLSGNSAVSPEYSVGGAICNYSFSFGSILVRNTTLANNSAVFSEDADPASTMAAMGGGVISSGGTVTVDNCTLSGNWDAGGPEVLTRAGGILVGDGANLAIKNTILDNDLSSPNIAAAPANDYYPGGTVTSYGYNLCTDDGSGLLTAAGDQINTAPLLGPLADNGGPTWTCALLAGSPAIDAADACDSADSPIKFDQRGVARPQGGFNDIGAFELEMTEPISALDVSDATVSREGKTSVVTVVISNPDTETARDALLTQATLGGMACVEKLPIGLGTIKPGKTKTLELTFKNVPSGDATLAIEGTCSLGDFSTTQAVTVP